MKSMKNLFKLIPVALGLLAFVSCSEDDFSQKSASLQNAGEGDLIVNFEDLQEEGSAFTRSYLSRDMKTRMYTTKDRMKVYDKELTAKYDIYQFSWKADDETAGVFRRLNTKSNLGASATPTYAVYPQLDNTLQWGDWQYTEGTENSETWFTTTIPDLYEYDAAYLLNGKNDTPLYEDVLPRWGKITATANGEALETNLSYLTGVLRLQLNGMPQYATAIKVQVMDGTTPLAIAGLFKTMLAKNDVMQEAEFAQTDLVVGGSDAIYVTVPENTDLIGDDAMKAVVYIPLVTTANSVDIVVTATSDDYTDTSTYPSGIYDNSITWNDCKTFANKTIKRGKIYGNSEAVNFAIDGETTTAISDAIVLAEGKADQALTLTATNTIDVTNDEYIIYIPNKDVPEIIVDLSAGLTASGTKPLTVKYKDIDGEGKYPGKVTLITPSASAVDLDVDLDSTPFCYKSAGANTAALDIDATELVLDGTAAATYQEANLTLSSNVKTLTVAANSTIDALTVKNDALKSLTAVNVLGKVTGAIDATDLACNVTATEEGKIGGATTTKGNINISKKATWGAALTAGGNITIDVAYASATTASYEIKADGNVSITSTGKELTIAEAITGKDVTLAKKVKAGDSSKKVTATQDLSVSDDSHIVGGADVKRNATINVNTTASGDDAVGGTLKFTGSGNLNLTQGLINIVDANNQTVGLYHGENAAYTAIGTLSNGSKFSAKNTSKWNGATDLGKYQVTVTDQIWTASQLGYQLTSAADFTLQSDIDLDNKNWTGIAPTAAYTISGNGHKISNINLVGNAGTTSEYAGFIGYPSDNVTISGFNFDGVKTTLKQNAEGSNIIGVGAVIGKTGKTATLTNVDVKLATGYFGSLNGTANEKISGVGGVIGFTGASSEVTLKGVAVDVNGATFAGWYGLGGLIGQASGNVTINKIAAVGDAPAKATSVTGLSEMEVTFLNTDAYDNDNNQGMTGYFIGTAVLSKSIIISDVADINPTFTVGGKANLAKAFNVSGSKMYTYSKGAQSLIGQSGFAAGKATINGTSYEVHMTDATTTPNNVLYKVTVTEYVP